MKNNTPIAARIRTFSLVELMVSMGMLVVMMGFLFQFVIGAQRIWSASNRNASTFTDAQLVFSLLERDLHNAIFQYSAEYPGRSVPMYLEDDGTNFTTFYLLSTIKAPNSGGTDDSQENIGYYPVVYRLVVDSGPPATPPFPTTPYILYRDAIDQNFTPPANPRPFIYFGSNEDNLPATWSYPPTEILCQNIKELKIAALPAPDSNGKFSTKPKAVKLFLTLYEPSLGSNENATPQERVFNKIIFLK